MRFSNSHISIFWLVYGFLAFGVGCASVGKTAGSNGSNVSGGTAAVCIFCGSQTTAILAETVDAKRTVLAPLENANYRDLVVDIIQAFQPQAYISVGGAIVGPDGSRKVDILVWPVKGDGGGPIAIDVIDRKDGRPVGVEAIDAADSKRRDVKAKGILLCSNTGFEVTAITKAKRVKVGLISALKKEDQRIRGKIEEEIYLRKATIAPATMTYEAVSVDDYHKMKNFMKSDHDVTYGGKSVNSWLQLRAGTIIAANPALNQPIKASFQLKRPTEFLVQGHPVTLKAISIQFRPQVQWLSQIVTLDATKGVYDYVRGRVQFGPGPGSYVIGGINFDTATPMAVPPSTSDLGVGLLPGEIDIQLTLITDLNMPENVGIAPLDDLVLPENLSTTH